MTFGVSTVKGPVSGQVELELGSRGVGEDEKGTVLRVVSMFAGGNLVSALLKMLAGFLTAKLIDPATLGLFNGLGLSRQYAQFLLVGVGPGMNRELAFYRGADDEQKVQEFASTALFYLVTAGTVVSLVLGGIGIYSLFSKGGGQIAAGWMTYAVVVPLSIIEVYMLGVFRVFDAFGRLATARVLMSLLLLAGLVFVYFFGFYGLCLRLLISSVLFMTLLWHWCPYRVKPSWNGPGFVELLKTGLPIWAANQVENLWDVLNSTLILKALGPEGFGLFAIARMAAESLRQLPSALQQVLQPRMAAKYGQSGDLGDSYRPLLIPALIVGTVFIPVAAVGWYLIPPVINSMLPKYAGGIEAAQWILIPVVLKNFRSPVAVLAAVSKRQYFNVGGLVFGILTYLVVLWKFGWPGNLQLVSFLQAFAAGGAVDLVVSHGLATYYLFRRRG